MAELEKVVSTSTSSTAPTDPECEAFPAGVDHGELNSDAVEPEYPDGGRKAWMTVFGSTVMLFCCGQLTAFGAFETWYTVNQLRDVSASTISWIGSMQLWILYFSGAVMGRIFDAYGPHVVLISGSVLLVVSTVLTSVCTQFYQFLIVQGLLTGLSYGMLFYPSFASMATHFKRYRATVSGIAISGSGLGGVVFPIMFRQLFTQIGFGWTVRASAFLLLALCVVGNLTITSRATPQKKKTPFIPDATIVRDAPFVLLVIGCFLVNTGLFVPLTYIANYAVSQGISPSMSFYIVSATNGGSIIGRIVPALISDMVGRFNIAAPVALLMGLLSIIVWRFAQSVGAVFAFGTFYGCFAGAFLAMQIPCVTQISKMEVVGTRIGILYSVSSFAVLAGGPMAGALQKAEHGGFQGTMVLCGLVDIVGAACILWAKLQVNGKVLARV